MATKTMKNGDIRQIAFDLSQRWESSKSNIKLSGKATYALIGLKRKLLSIGDEITEAFGTVGLALGGKVDEMGMLKIPDDKIDEANKQLTEIAVQTQEIEFTPIVLNEEDELPMELMDILYDFIEIH